MKPKIIQQGAEAIIYLVSPRSKNFLLTKPSLGVGREGIKQFIIKDRIKKSYRLPELDEKIRKRRTKSETKLLIKTSKIINAPVPTHTTNIYQIPIPFIDGKKLSEHLDSFSLEKQKQICKQIGESIAKIHDKDIIHGDLTTSNMILSEGKIKNNNFMRLLEKIKQLKLPKKEYVIFGSGPLIIRGLRDSSDVDLLVSKKLFEEYKKKIGWKFEEVEINGRKIKRLTKEEIEIYLKWGPGKWNPKKIIEDSEIINGLPFANLNEMVKWKKIKGRKKDLEDIKLIKDYQNNKEKVFFIDFGLGFISRKFEDKAVDLHLLKQALEAKHFKHWKELLEEVFKGYKKSKDSKIVFERLKAVEKRGRYKH